MKPICSIKGGRCFTPTGIRMLDGVVRFISAEFNLTIHLPEGLTFERFMHDYLGCKTPVYFVEEG